MDTDFSISSPSFIHNGNIPIKHTCEAEDISPELIWKNTPEGTKSLVLIVDDPDAPDPQKPQMTYVHWVLYNIPANTDHLKEGIKSANLPKGTLEGVNDWSNTGYGGPCPPIGAHRYFHKLYALNDVLPDLNLPTKDQLLAAMNGKIIAKTEIIGIYQKQLSK